MDVSNDYFQLVRRVKELLIAYQKWVEQNGYPHSFGGAPQYNEMRAIGEKLNELGGIELMRDAFREVERHIPYLRMSEFWWHRIGSWEA